MEYEKFIAQDAALARRFEKVRIDEPNFERTVEIVRRVSLTRYAEMTISDAAIKTLVRLAARFVKEKRHNPDKSLAVLDYAAAWQKNYGTGSEITEETIKNALAEKLCVARERLEDGSALDIRQLEAKLREKFPAWKKEISQLAAKMSEAITRGLRHGGPLCKAALAGSDAELLGDIAYSSAQAMGFEGEEIIRATPDNAPARLINPFLINPNRAVIIEIQEGDAISADCYALLSAAVKEGRFEAQNKSVSYALAPVFVLFVGKAEKSGAIGFSEGEAAGRTRLSAELEPLQKALFAGAQPICFGAIDENAASELYTKRFLPLLEKQRAKLGAPEISISDEAREFVIKKLAAADGWSAAAKITEHLVRGALMNGKGRYIAELDKNGLTLQRIEMPAENGIEIG